MATLEEKRLGQIAVEKGLATREQVNEVQAEVDEAAMQGREASLLGMLTEKGLIDERQQTEILKAAEAAGPVVLGDFEIERLLGRGGMGEVYRAREISMDRVCALKLLPTRLAKGPAIVARFHREAQSCAKLDHPNIIRGYRVGEVEGQHYFAMEFVEGASVAAMLEKGALPIDQCVKIMRQIVSALSAAHKAGIIHRDIKPDNIMVTKDGVAKLADLGLAKAADTEQTRLTMSQSGMGTPAYMPPEQAKGAKHADARSDVYALGATFYHMVTGRMPYEGDSAYEVMKMHEEGVLKSARSVRAEVPSWLDLVIGKMMQRKPENRFQTAYEVAEAIERHAASAVTAGAAAAAGKQKEPVHKYWHLRIPRPDGGFGKAKAETASLRILLAKGKVPLTALAKRGIEGRFKPINEYPQLMDTVKAVKAHKDKRGQGGLSAFYKAYETASAHRRRMRKVRRIAIRCLVVGVVIGAIVIGVAYRSQIIEWVSGLLGR